MLYSLKQYVIDVEVLSGTDIRLCVSVCANERLHQLHHTTIEHMEKSHYL